MEPIAAAGPVGPDPKDIQRAIAEHRHQLWHKVKNGGCSNKKNDCSAIFSFDSLPQDLKATKRDLEACLCKEEDICLEEETGPGLCDLHKDSWASWGAKSCSGLSCASHTWPTKEKAPLPYLGATSPRQAVILRHFNLLTLVDVENLIRDHFKAAIFVAHLLHNNGQPDASAMDLLDDLKDPVRRCLTVVWDCEDVTDEELTKEQQDQRLIITPEEKRRRTPTKPFQVEGGSDTKKTPARRLSFASPKRDSSSKKAEKSRKSLEKKERTTAEEDELRNVLDELSAICADAIHRVRHARDQLGLLDEAQVSAMQDFTALVSESKADLEGRLATWRDLCNKMLRQGEYYIGQIAVLNKEVEQHISSRNAQPNVEAIENNNNGPADKATPALVNAETPKKRDKDHAHEDIGRNAANDKKNEKVN